MAAEKLLIGGRTYVEVGVSTVQHDFSFMALLRHAGLDSVAVEPGETPEAFADRVLGLVIGSGRALLMLGHLIMPEGATWSPDVAAATAEHLGSLSEPADKARVRSELLSMLLSFFERGLASSRTSPTSSASAGSAGATGASPTSESGGRSSAPSQGTTTT